MRKHLLTLAMAFTFVFVNAKTESAEGTETCIETIVVYENGKCVDTYTEVKEGVLGEDCGITIIWSLCEEE